MFDGGRGGRAAIVIPTLSTEWRAGKLKHRQLTIGSLAVRAICPQPSFWDAFDFHYGEHAPSTDAFCDFSLRLVSPGLVRRFWRPQVVLETDGERPFLPLPSNQAFPLFEWGLNWCVSTNLHRWVIIHAAVVEREGRAAILPAPPGSGKSTLCAALVSRGWRLLSDELAMIDPDSLLLSPFPRPISLKNQSIDLMRAFASPDQIGPVFRDTHKGDIAHMRVPASSRRQQLDCVPAAWIVFPKYRANAALRAESIGRARTVLELAANSFNQDRLGETGFRTLSATAAHSRCVRFEYSALDDAIAYFERLAGAP